MTAQVHRPGPERRQLLIDATIRVMRRKGLIETTGRDVARESGASVGLLHHYFDSQDALLVAAFEQVARQDLDRVQRHLDRAAGSVARLSALVRYFAPGGRGWQYRLWIDAWAASAHHPQLRRSSRRYNRAWEAVFASVVAEGVADGSFVCEDVAASSWRILALLDGMAVQTVAGQTATPRSTLQRWVTDAAAAEVRLPRGSL